MNTSLQTNQTQAVSTPAPRTIRGYLEGEQFRMSVAKALPSHLTPERFIRVAITATTKNPKLLQCDEASFFGALLSLSQLGLEPDGRNAHLIPYGTTCQLIIDYKGLVELIMRSGLVSYIHADKVCEADEFIFDRGELKSHTINFKMPRGSVYCYYALCRFKDGTEKVEVMTKPEIDAIRNRSRAGNAGPWVTDYDEMAKKTVFRRLSKWISISAEFRDALDKDADTIEEQRFNNAVQAKIVEGPTFSPASAPEVQPEALSTPTKRKYTKRTQEPQQPTPAAAASAPEPDPVPAGTPPQPNTPQQELEAQMTAGNVSFDAFTRWAGNTDRLDNFDSYTTWEELPTEWCESILKDPKALGKCVVLNAGK